MTLTIALAVFIGILTGALAHELAHANMAMLLGATVSFDWWRLNVYYQFPEGDSSWKLVLVNTAPYVAAAVGGVVWYLGVFQALGFSAFTAGSMVFVMMLVYGGIDDWRLTPAETSDAGTAD